jgi:hypothetical protein
VLVPPPDENIVLRLTPYAKTADHRNGRQGNRVNPEGGRDPIQPLSCFGIEGVGLEIDAGPGVMTVIMLDW